MRSCITMTIVGFFAGSLMFSYFIPKWFLGIDIRENTDDGNPGSTNAIKSAGLPIGLLCMFLDILKAFMPIFISVNYLDISGLYLVPVIAAPSAGHAFSPFLGFKGGKSVSTLYGSLLGILTISKAVFFVAALMILFKTVIVIKPDSAMVTASLIGASAAVLYYEPLYEVKIAVTIICLIASYKILKNPNKGDIVVSVWNFRIIFNDGKVKVKHI